MNVNKGCFHSCSRFLFTLPGISVFNQINLDQTISAIAGVTI